MKPTIVRSDGSELRETLALKRISERDAKLFTENIKKLEK